MRQKVWTMLGIVFVLTALTGCGGEYVGISGAGAASGSAVSGGVVSGSAVETEGKNEDATLYRYCNDRFLYYVEEDGLVEHDRKTDSEQKLPVEEVAGIYYVDNDWIYYAKQENAARVWRIPARSESRMELVERKEELIFESEDVCLNDSSWIEGIMCDGKYIAYTTCDLSVDWNRSGGSYREYDLSTGEEKTYDSYDALFGVCDGYAVVGNEYDENVFVKTLGKDDAELVSNGFQGIKPMKAGRGFCWEEESDSGQVGNIWYYEWRSGKKNRLISVSELSEFLEKNGFLECEHCQKPDIDSAGMFISGEKLYLQLSLCGEDKDHTQCRNAVMVSRKLDGSDELQLEETLTKYLSNPVENQKVFQKNVRHSTPQNSIFLSRGLCVAMSEDICLMYLEHTEKEKNEYACYDFHSGEFRWLSENDPECLILKYDYYNIYPDCHYRKADFLMLNAEMPNNFDFSGGTD